MILSITTLPVSVNIEVSSGFGVLFCFGVFSFGLVLVFFQVVFFFLPIASFSHRGDKRTKNLTKKPQ